LQVAEVRFFRHIVLSRRIYRNRHHDVSLFISHCTLFVWLRSDNLLLLFFEHIVLSRRIYRNIIIITIITVRHIWHNLQWNTDRNLLRNSINWNNLSDFEGQQNFQRYAASGTSLLTTAELSLHFGFRFAEFLHENYK